MWEVSKEELLNEVKKYYEELCEARKHHEGYGLLNMRNITLKDMNLAGQDLHGIDFSYASFYDLCLDGADLSGCILNNALFQGCTLRRAALKNADLEGCALRGADMRECDICGANLFSAVLEKADLKGCVSDENTRFFRLYCPEKGPFIGYKKCCNDRIVELLIPADAKRTSATRNSCRCSKAKVMVIKSIDNSEYFDEAWSLVKEGFVYRKGGWVEVLDFDEDRWNDSTTGIHFWMTREEAIKY